jgi:hypothetical protein
VYSALLIWMVSGAIVLLMVLAAGNSIERPAPGRALTTAAENVPVPTVTFDPNDAVNSNIKEYGFRHEP